MSVTFYWQQEKPTQHPNFKHGTSNDERILKETFGGRISSADIPTLRAMHRTSGQKESLWSEIADTLERLQGDDQISVAIKIWPEY